jgi:hypothetical protein
MGKKSKRSISSIPHFRTWLNKREEIEDFATIQEPYSTLQTIQSEAMSTNIGGVALSKEEEQEFREIFNLVDKDKVGLLVLPKLHPLLLLLLMMMMMTMTMTMSLLLLC